MSGPRSLPAGEVAGASVIVIVMFVATLYVVGIAAIGHYVVSRWFRRK